MNSLNPAVNQAIELDSTELAHTDFNDLVPKAQTLLPVVEAEVANRNIPGHTPFQVSRFVIEEVGDQITNFGKAFQALRELSSRQGSLMQAIGMAKKAQGQMKVYLAKRMELNEQTTETEAEKLRLEGRLEILDANITESRTTIIGATQQAESAAREMEWLWNEYQAVLPADYEERFEEYDRREWRARCVMRAFLGKFSYLPPLETEELEELVGIGVTLRFKGYSERQLRCFVTELWDNTKPLEVFIKYVSENTPEVDRPRIPVSNTDLCGINDENVASMIGPVFQRMQDKLEVSDPSIVLSRLNIQMKPKLGVGEEE